MFKFYKKYEYKTEYEGLTQAFKERQRWADDTKSKHPIQFFFRETLLDEFHFLGYRIRDIYYYLKCLFFRRYHILKLRDDPRWMDSDTKIELALEKILFDFVENEMDMVDWEATPEHSSTKKTLLTCYNFFKVELPSLTDSYDKMLDSASKAEFKDGWLEKLNDEENRIEELTTSHLVDIIKVRKSMWT